MQSKDTPSKYYFQLGLSKTQREQLKARAAEKQLSMTQFALQAMGLAAPAKPSAKPTKRRWKPKPRFVELEGKDQQQEWIRAVEAARGREIAFPEWENIHALFLGLRLMVPLKKEWWPRMHEWRAGRYTAKDVEETRMLRALADFEPLRKAQFKLWDAETGYSSTKRREKRAKNLGVVKAQDAARQRKHYAKVHAPRREAEQVFIDEHVTEHVPANDTNDSKAEAAE